MCLIEANHLFKNLLGSLIIVPAIAILNLFYTCTVSSKVSLGIIF